MQPGCRLLAPDLIRQSDRLFFEFFTVYRPSSFFFFPIQQHLRAFVDSTYRIIAQNIPNRLFQRSFTKNLTAFRIDKMRKMW